jgi:hypothetical protein
MAVKDSGNFIVRLVLTRFFGAQVKLIENENGEMEECVCIPLERNDLKKSDRGNVSAYFFMTKTRVANMYGWTHYLRQKVNPMFLKKINEMGFQMFYAGNAKDGNYIVHKNNYQQKFVKIEEDE